MLKKMLVCCLLLALCLTGCGEAASVQSSSAVAAPETSSPVSAPPQATERPVPEDPEEARLLEALEQAAGSEAMWRLCLDMDRDGAKELLGVCFDEAAGQYKTWYCSSDGSVCAPVYQDELGLDVFSLEPLEQPGETHVAVNSHVGMGSTSRFTVLTLRQGEIVCLVREQPGNVQMDEAGDVLLRVEDYDAQYDAAVGGMIGHTVKTTYLLFAEDTYKEYRADELTREEFLALENAPELEAAIVEDLRFEEYEQLEYRYFWRGNGILQVQCDLVQPGGFFNYGYYTVRCQAGAVETSPGQREPGRMAAALSTLEAA